MASSSSSRSAKKPAARKSTAKSTAKSSTRTRTPKPATAEPAFPGQETRDPLLVVRERQIAEGIDPGMA
jgi:hypothetical protein